MVKEEDKEFEKESDGVRMADRHHGFILYTKCMATTGGYPPPLPFLYCYQTIFFYNILIKITPISFIPHLLIL